MIDLRRVTLNDVGAVVELSLEALHVELARSHQPLRVSEGKVRQLVHLFAIERHHFNLVAFDGDRCVGALAALVTEIPFFERQEAIVVICYVKAHPLGLRMVRQFIRWFHSEPRLRRVQWQQNPSSYGERMGHMLARRHRFRPETNMVLSKE